jgi:hypothetical protein
MQIYHSQALIDRLPASLLKIHIQKRFDTLFETEDDLLPNLVLVEATDDVIGPDYSFVGPDGLLSDLWEEHEPGHPEFARPFEWASYLSELKIYEVLLLIHGEDGVFIYVPDSIVDANPKLHWVLTAESQGGLSNPQPLY